MLLQFVAVLTLVLTCANWSLLVKVVVEIVIWTRGKGSRDSNRAMKTAQMDLLDLLF